MIASVMMPRRRRIARLLETVTDLYGGDEKSLFVELERQAGTTLNRLGLNGLGRSSAVVTELQRVYRDSLHAHERLLLESLQRVLRSNRFVPRRGEVKQIVEFVLKTIKPMAVSLNEKINTHARNAGVGSAARADDVEAGLDARIRGEVAVLVADLRKDVILPWRERAVGKIVIGVLIGVLVALLVALLLRLLDIGDGAAIERDTPKLMLGGAVIARQIRQLLWDSRFGRALTMLQLRRAAGVRVAGTGLGMEGIDRENDEGKGKSCAVFRECGKIMKNIGE